MSMKRSVLDTLMEVSMEAGQWPLRRFTLEFQKSILHCGKQKAFFEDSRIGRVSWVTREDLKDTQECHFVRRQGGHWRDEPYRRGRTQPLLISSFQVWEG